MRLMSIQVVAATLVIGLMAGCASSPAVMRAQSPDGNPDGPYGAVQQVNHSGSSDYYYNMGMDPMAQGYCGPDGCGHEFCAPPSCYRFQYRVPQGLNYPPPNAMPGMVQYPYYTVKGPDCFFHQ